MRGQPCGAPGAPGRKRKNDRKGKNDGKEKIPTRQCRVGIVCKGKERAAYLPQLSFRVVTRLNTGLPGRESTRSATK